MVDFKKNKVLIGLTTTAALIPLVTFFNVPLPRFAWSVEVQQLEEKQLEFVDDMYSRELGRQKLENYKLQHEKKRIEREEGQIPNTYLEAQKYIEQDIEGIERKLKETQERLLQLKK